MKKQLTYISINSAQLYISQMLFIINYYYNTDDDGVNYSPQNESITEKYNYYQYRTFSSTCHDYDIASNSSFSGGRIFNIPHLFWDVGYNSISFFWIVNFPTSVFTIISSTRSFSMVPLITDPFFKVILCQNLRQEVRQRKGFLLLVQVNLKEILLLKDTI